MSNVDEKRIEELRDRVGKFRRFELPDQPIGMHMGTAYLVSDLLSMIEDLARSVPSPQG